MGSTETEGQEAPAAIILSDHRRSILSLLIDGAHYAAQAGVEFADPGAALEHFLHVGGPSGLDPSPTFRSARYMDAVPHVRAAGQNPLVHYLFEAGDEAALIHALDGLSPAAVADFRAHFDADWYARHNLDVDLAVNDPFVHYLTTGWRERRDPSPTFSTAAYLDVHADVRETGIHPFRHWVLHGIPEGRSSGMPASSALDSWEGLSVSQQAILSRIFEIGYYRAHLAAGDRGSPLAVQVASDATGGSVTPTFHAARYVAAHPEIRGAGPLPFLHYLFETVGEDALRDLFFAYPVEALEGVFAHFDAAWYLYSYPDVEASGQDAFIHYMTAGWRQNYDPTRDFSTRAYLLRYPDIVEADMNPLLHWVMFGKAEGRSGASFASNFRNRLYAPSITAILINGEADPLTPACIAAVLHQSHVDLAILIVGAPLSAACRQVVEEGRGDGAVSIGYLPDTGATPTWRLVEQAAEQATGDLLWIVRGGGVHDFEYLARLASSFADGSVQLGFGRRLEPDDADYAIGEEELARQMEGWTRHVTTPAARWFPARLDPDLLAQEPHSILWRRRALDGSVWREAGEYRHLGLWHLLLHMASGGQIATVRDALVRSPMSAALPALPEDEDFRRDLDRLSAEVRSFWAVPGGSGDAEAERTKRHILIVTHGIFAGGAENLPIQLANELVKRGVIVSLLIFKTDVNPEMRATLNPGVSIYESDWVLEHGCEPFIHDIGCSLIHSHGVIGEMFFFRLCERPLAVPYVATLHGSYEASTSTELPERFIARIVRNVDLFVYTADKNLAPLLRNGVRPDRLVKMINAMPVDPAAFPRSRAEMGIAEDAVVFTLIARGIREKGWNTAVNAFHAIRQRHPGRAMHLCLVGEGDEPDRLAPLHAGDPAISFLGFQLRIHGLYRMTDVAIVPTRFAGESFPLCIIQALQVAVPVIATDVGEIASMLEVDGVAGGIVVPASENDEIYDARFTEAMESLIDDGRRARLAEGAGLLGARYDMGAFTDQYVDLYESVMRRFAASPPADRAVADPVDAA
ncbi:glycosyltransferase family 4 protein [Sphingomonas profundi]|uniref:glycosyltransferase family 4 protein n=1 Tax=Alterirhizorhabdus profundi TaxID=2681549 RepID=UPI0018D18381|nr:glycosyltransferase family 4 protein [Sphingomonas profundi]